ncbi:putative accessory movemet protein [Bermuda grass latent virus]|uniref:putative accessory movemet protein n=1 Tax=Bermuda grass latent virus TaxID=1930269 RepID=UPI000948451F|nr:putative accessory movemet protein [Bermuda grass latent virus]APQ46241.1 putative accessory movemet protein [Bermuda grass latent virus]
MAPVVVVNNLPPPGTVAAREIKVLGARVVEVDLWNEQCQLPPRTLWVRRDPRAWGVDRDGQVWLTRKSYFKSLLVPAVTPYSPSPSFQTCSIRQTVRLIPDVRNSSQGTPHCTPNTNGTCWHSNGHQVVQRLHLETWF